VLTYLLATPTQNYALTDLWLSHYVMWTMGPWLLLLAWRLLGATGRDAARAALLLGLVAGVALATTHPGHVPVYGTVVLAVGAARYGALRARWRWIALAAVIALVIRAAYLGHDRILERRRRRPGRAPAALAPLKAAAHVLSSQPLPLRMAGTHRCRQRLWTWTIFSSSCSPAAPGNGCTR